MELTPIGHIESCFGEKFATPRQGALVPDARATLRLELGDGMDPRAALDGIEEYSHVWLLWSCHLNGHTATQAKVRAPRLRGGKAGVFATRSPFRPNPVGLSLVRLQGVEGDTLSFSGIDLVDGTPILDVKPYIPAYDAPTEAPQDGDATALRTASWVDPPGLPVRFSADATATLLSVANDRRTRRLLPDAESLRRTLVQALAADPRPLYRWRRQQASEGPAEYDVAIDGVVARCRFERQHGEAGGPGSDCVTVIALSAAG